MGTMQSSYGRTRLGGRYYTGHYWTAFLACSLLTHIIALAVMSDAALTFFQSISRPQPAVYPLLYISLIYPDSTPLRAVQSPAEPPTVPARKPAIRSQAVRVKEAYPEKPPPDTIKPIPVPEKGADRKPPVTAALKKEETPNQEIKMDTTPREPIPNEKAAAGTKAFEKEAEPNTIVVIKGTEKETLAVADLPSPPAIRFGHVTEKKPDIMPLALPAAAGQTPVEQRAPVPLANMSIPSGKAAERPAPSLTALNGISSTEAPAPIPPPFRHFTSTGPASPSIAAGETNSLPPPVFHSEKETGLGFIKPLGLDGPSSLVRDAAMLLAQAASGHAAPNIKITEPAEGDTTQGTAAVKGVAAGEGVNSVILTVGKQVKELLLRDGTFETSVTLAPGENVLEAMTTDVEGHESRDRVTVNYTPRQQDLSVRATYSGEGGRLHLRCAWRKHPLADAGASGTPQPHFDVAEDSHGAQVIVRVAVPGIYTVGVEYETGPDKTSNVIFDATLYNNDASKKRTVGIGPVELKGSGFLPAIRVLFPEGVFWEDDGWFTGSMESSQETMKYKEPEGIVWREEK